MGCPAGQMIQEDIHDAAAGGRGRRGGRGRADLRSALDAGPDVRRRQVHPRLRLAAQPFLPAAAGQRARRARAPARSDGPAYSSVTTSRRNRPRRIPGAARRRIRRARDRMAAALVASCPNSGRRETPRRRTMRLSGRRSRSSAASGRSSSRGSATGCQTPVRAARRTVARDTPATDSSGPPGRTSAGASHPSTEKNSPWKVTRPRHLLEDGLGELDGAEALRRPLSRACGISASITAARSRRSATPPTATDPPTRPLPRSLESACGASRRSCGGRSGSPSGAGRYGGASVTPAALAAQGV